MKFGRLFTASKKNAATAKKAPANAGDIWTWTAIDADTKLIPSWFRGVHHALQGVDAAEPYNKLVAAQLLKALRNLLADDLIMGCFVATGNRQIQCRSAPPHRDGLLSSDAKCNTPAD